MRVKVFEWLEHEFVALSAEATAGNGAVAQTEDLFHRFEEQLQGLGLSLENVVRTRLWGRDREARDQGGTARVGILSGRARSASSSYIAPAHFDSQALIAVDLLAMRPGNAGAEKTIKEYDPPIVPVRYISYEGIVFLSGVTAVLPSLEEQVPNILGRIGESLADAGSGWDRAERVSFYLHRDQRMESLKALFERAVQARAAQREYGFVDGYSLPGKLIEIEVTATQ